MELTGTPEVLRRLIIKKIRLERGDPSHTEIRPLLLVLSGSMRGVYGGGQVTALTTFGLREAFDAAVGISTGAPTAAYFLAGQARLGTKVYSEECTQPHFISTARFLRGGVVMDVDWVSQVFRGEVGNKRLDQNAVRLSRTSFHTVATEVESGEVAFLDAKTITSDIIESLRASIAMPGISHGNVVIHGKRYCDGGAYSLPAEEVISKFQPTDILVLANHSPKYRSQGKLQERILQRFIMRKYSPKLRALFENRHKQFGEGYRYLRSQRRCSWAVLWSDGEIDSYTTDSKKLQAAALRAEEHLSLLLEEARAGVS